MQISRRALLSGLCAALLPAAEDITWITRLGGKIQRNPAGTVVAIDLGTTWVSDDEMLDLLAFPQLERLNLSHTRISDEGLLRLKPAAQIQELSLLYAEQITDLGLSAIKQWRRLKKLNVRGTRIGDETLALVAALVQIESLDIADTNITDNGLDNLVPLTRLKHLALGRSRLTDESLSGLRVFSTLESLDLGGPRSTNRNQRGRASAPMRASLVAAIAELKELRTLRLGYSDIDEGGLRGLAVLEKVEKLELEGCRRIDDKALKVLDSWKALKYLDVQETAVSSTAVASFRAAKPGVQILSGPFAGERSLGSAPDLASEKR